MYKYLKAIYHIFKNYHLYSVPVLLNELIFYFKYNNAFNKFKYLKSDFLSDSIPCSYFFLKEIKRFIIKHNLKYLCDLGSGYGKILYFFGNLNKYKIDGVELDSEIFLESNLLKSNDIRIFNEDILKFDLRNIKYDLFIMNDPLKKNQDLMKLIFEIKKAYKEVYLVFINIDQEKLKSVENNLKIIKSSIISKNRNIIFCSIN